MTSRETQFELEVQNKRLGPMGVEQVLELIERGYLSPMTLCRPLGASNWSYLKEHELFLQSLIQARDQELEQNTLIRTLDLANHQVRRSENFQGERTTDQWAALLDGKDQDTSSDSLSLDLQEQTRKIDIYNDLDDQSEEQRDKKFTVDTQYEFEDQDDRTIISPRTLDYLEELAKQRPQHAISPPPNVSKLKPKSQHKRPIIEDLSSAPTQVIQWSKDSLKKAFLEGEKNWKSLPHLIKKRKQSLKRMRQKEMGFAKHDDSLEENEQEDEGSKKKSKKSSLIFFILVLLGVFLILPDDPQDTDQQQELSKETEDYLLPTFPFPNPFVEKDRSAAEEQLLKAQELIKLTQQHTAYPSLLKAKDHLLAAYELDDTFQPALDKLILVYAQLLSHAQEVVTPSVTIYNLIKLAHQKSATTSVDLLTGSMLFFSHLNKHHVTKKMFEIYVMTNDKVGEQAYATYLEALLELGAWEDAEKLLERWKTFEKKSPLFFVGQLHYARQLGDTKQMLTVFEQAMSQYPQHLEVLLAGLDLAWAKRDWETLKKILTAMDVLHFDYSLPYFAKGLYYRGLLEAINNNLEVATGFMKRSLELVDDPNLRRNLASLKASKEKTPAATLALITESKAIDLMNRSKQHLQKKLWDQALSDAVKAVSLAPLNLKVQLHLATVQEKLGFLAEAIKNYQRVKTLSPLEPGAVAGLMRVYGLGQQWHRGIALMNEQLQSPLVQDPEYLSAVGHFFEQKKDLNKALNWYQKALVLMPLRDDDLFAIARIAYQLNDMTLAKSVLLRALDLNPYEAPYKLLMADIYYDTLGTDVALGYLRTFLKEQQGSDAVYQGKMAVFYYKAGQISDYEKLSKELSFLTEGSEELYFLLLEQARKENRINDFYTNARKYLNLVPGELSIRLALVEAYYEQQQYDLALKELTELEQRMPQYPRLQYFKARIALARGQAEQAMELALKEVQDNPQDEFGHLLLGDLFRLKELYNDAEKSYRLAQRINPRSVQAIKGMAQIRMNKNDLSSALDLIRKALSWRPDDSSLYLVEGDLCRQLGQHQEAIKAYKNFLELEPESTHRSTIEGYLKAQH